MTADFKICGIKDSDNLDATIRAGARWVGFVFFPKSPRHVGFDQAASLVRQAAGRIETVALMVEPEDALVARVTDSVNPDWIQLHGKEDPRRCADIKARTGKKIIKAFGISRRDDLAAIEPYLDVVDMVLFDAKPPKDSNLPGGNAVSFDWTILQGFESRKPWMLSGGLNPDNVGDALRISGATILDISSGVEASRGVKDPALIAAFADEIRQAGAPDLSESGSGLIL